MSAVPTVSDEEAQGRVREIFDDIRSTLKVPFVNLVFRTLAPYPAYLELAWGQIKPNAGTRFFQEITDGIRMRAMEGIGGEFSLSNHLVWLKQQGYDAGEIRRVDEVIRLFHSVNPRLLGVTTVLLQSLEGREVGGDPGTTREVVGLEEEFAQPTELVSDEAASPQVRAVFEDIQRTLAIPITPCDYRALARWPDYLQMAWGELMLIVRSEPYRVLRGKIDVYTTTSVRRLPYAVHAGRKELLAAGISAEEIEEITSRVRLFQGLLPGLILNMAAMKLALEKGGVQP